LKHSVAFTHTSTQRHTVDTNKMPSPDTLAAAAVEMLDYATTPRQLEGTLERDYLLHPGLIQQAKALQFVLTQKAGLLLALGEGHGFTVFKLRTFDDGSTAWSAPCFLTAPSVSTGATVGASSFANGTRRQAKPHTAAAVHQPPPVRCATGLLAKLSCVSPYPAAAAAGKQQTCALLVVLSDKAAELLRAGHSTGAAVGAQANLTPPRGEWMSEWGLQPAWLPDMRKPGRSFV
jgi:hypothetical protein